MPSRRSRSRSPHKSRKHKSSRRDRSDSRSRDRKRDKKKKRRRRDDSDSDSRHKSRKKRRRSPSRSPSRGRSGSRSGSGAEGGAGVSEKQRRKAERAKLREDKAARKAAREAARKDRERRKASETPLERAKRRAAKKAKEKETYFGYTNDDNPYGDSQLTTAFVWKKKLSSDVKAGRGSGKVLSKKEFRARQERNLEEIQRVKERRRQREIEMEERERLRQEEISLKEAEMYGDFERKEAEFQRKATKRKTRLRIKHGRETAIDALAKNLILLEIEERKRARRDSESESEGDDEDQTQVELREPYVIVDSLPLQELQELLPEIAKYQDVMKDNPKHVRYWAALAVVAEDAVLTAKARVTGVSRYEAGVKPSIVKDLAEMFGEKTSEELRGMVDEVADQREDAEAHSPADAPYWREVQRALAVHIKRAELREFHAEVLEKRLAYLEEAGLEMAVPAAAAGAGAGAGDAVVAASEWDATGKAAADPLQSTNGEFSPELLSEYSQEDGVDMISEEEYVAEVQALVLSVKPAAPEGDSGEASFLARAAGELEEGEASMGDGDEIVVAPEGGYTWQDKYRPRKPRFFNRVKTGYEWNSYNQMHYDHDNPPPKTVQGYKFNIFYPHLIDKTKTPSFFLEPADVDEFCIIRFHAGPPYEDIAFKIMNREWEKGHRQGFKCMFHRGVLQLHFNFKAFRYKR